MNKERQLKVQALLDGELADKEAGEVAAWVARDPEAAALLAELRHTNRVLSDSELAIKLPEAREFYWSKIEREIRKLATDSEPAPAIPFLVRLRRLLVPAAAVAALAVIATFVSLRSGTPGPALAPSQTQMTVADASAFTYQDFANGTTLVWVSYPAESEFAKK